jgi:iron complex outermembrane receptor protein
VLPLDDLRLEAKVDLLDAKFTHFQRDPSDPSTSLAGNQTAFSPKFSFYGGARYTVPVAETYGLSLHADTSYKGAHYFNVDNLPALHQDGYWLLNASIELARSDNLFSVTAWLKNATDTRYFATGLANSGLGFLELIPGMPRTFGATVGVKF